MAMYILPAITVPYLARVLGVSGWGRYSFALALSTQLATLVEYGFGITGNRAVASHRDEPGAISHTLGAVITAKTALIVVACVIAVVVYARTPSFQQQASLFWFSVAAGITQGFSFTWYLYGIERMALAVGIELSNRILVAGSILLLIKTPSDTWIFFALQTLTNIAAVMVGLSVVARSHEISWPGLSSVAMTLRLGFSAMLSRPGFGIFTGMNTLILGFYASSEIVGQYAGAERIARVVTALTGPMCQALFPRFSYLLRTDPLKLRRLRILGGAATLMLGGLASIATYALAPLATSLLLGAGYGGSMLILRIFSPLPLLAAVNHVLLFQYLFPIGAFGYIALSLAGTTLIVLAVAAVLGWASSASAMALAAVVAEAAAGVLLLMRARRA